MKLTAQMKYDGALFKAKLEEILKRDAKKDAMIGFVSHEQIEEALRVVLGELLARVPPEAEEGVFEIICEIVENIFLLITIDSDGRLNPHWKE